MFLGSLVFYLNIQGGQDDGFLQFSDNSWNYDCGGSTERCQDAFMVRKYTRSVPTANQPNSHVTSDS